MIGLEFMDQDKKPLTQVVSKIREISLAHDVMLLSCGVDDSVIRLIPPLIIDEDELSGGLDIVESAIAEATA
jgi:4-aminobutyrate aminotransferase